MDLVERLRALARITAAPAPVVSAYLGTRWRDEHQRERLRVFVKHALRKARRDGRALAADLDWIEGQAEACLAQVLHPEAHGVALFACGALGVREVLPLRLPVEEAFVVEGRPYLRPLAVVAGEAPSTLVVFVDGESARLIPLGPEGVGEEVALESDVPGQHRRGGWALLAQSRYRRHLEDHRGRHFDAVAAALAHLVAQDGVERVVLAGEPGTLAGFRQHLPSGAAALVAGAIPAARHEPAAALAARATALLAEVREAAGREAIDAVLTEAAKGATAVAGVEATLEAASRGAIHRLHLLAGFRERGRACSACGALQPGDGDRCRVCGGATVPVELGEALVDRVIATGGAVDTVREHEALGSAGGVAARLRYPL